MIIRKKLTLHLQVDGGGAGLTHSVLGHTLVYACHLSTDPGNYVYRVIVP